MRLVPKNKTGGVVTGTIMGVGGLIVGTIVILVLVSTLIGADLLSAGQYNTSATGMANNFTAGLNNVSEKIPTILLIVAVVFLFGALVLLVAQARNMGIGSGGSSL